MKLLVAADDNGSLKEITCIKGTDTSVQTATQPEKIQCFHEEGIRNRVERFIIVKDPKSEQSFVIAARINGNISVYLQNETYDLIKTLPDNLITGSESRDKFVSLFESFGVIVAVTEQGKVNLIDLGSISEEQVKASSITVKAPITAFVPHPEQRGVYAYGGKENDLKVIRLFSATEKDIFSKEALTIEELFKAKNVKNDKLDLRVPIWISNIVFVELSQHTDRSWRFITTTRYGQVRKYDTAHGKKPILDKKILEKPIICVAQTTKENEIICSDTHDTIALFNIEKCVLIKKYKGSVGATQDLHTFLEKDVNLLVAGGLDRYLRVFDINSNKQIVKVFVGSKISSVWLLDSTDPEIIVPETAVDKKIRERRERREQEENADQDDIWNELDALQSKNKKRRTTK